MMSNTGLFVAASVAWTLGTLVWLQMRRPARPARSPRALRRRAGMMLDAMTRDADGEPSATPTPALEGEAFTDDLISRVFVGVPLAESTRGRATHRRPRVARLRSFRRAADWVSAGALGVLVVWLFVRPPQINGGAPGAKAVPSHAPTTPTADAGTTPSLQIVPPPPTVTVVAAPLAAEMAALAGWAGEAATPPPAPSPLAEPAPTTATASAVRAASASHRGDVLSVPAEQNQASLSVVWPAEAAAFACAVNALGVELLPMRDNRVTGRLVCDASGRFAVQPVPASLDVSEPRLVRLLRADALPAPLNEYDAVWAIVPEPVNAGWQAVRDRALAETGVGGPAVVEADLVPQGNTWALGTPRVIAK